MSALTGLRPRLCTLGALVSLCGACFFMSQVTPEEATTEFQAQARYTEVIDAAASVLESNGFMVESLRQASLTAARVRQRTTARTPAGNTRCTAEVCVTSTGGGVSTGSDVQTLVIVEAMPRGDNTAVRVRVEKRGSASLYSSDVKLSRKIAKLLEEELAERAG